MNFDETPWTTIALILVVLAVVSCGDPKPPKYGVVHFGYYSGFILPGINETIIENYNKEGKVFAVLRFRSGPGKFINLGFMLKSPEGDDYIPRYFKQGSDKHWEIAAFPEKKILNPIWINQIAGDIDLQLIYVIKGQPSTEWELIYEDKSTSSQSYKIVKGALYKE